MNLKITLAAAATAITLAAVSCQDGSEIGESLVTDHAQVVIDSSFTVTGRSVADTAVLSRTVTQLLGSIDAPGYGRLSSDVVTQFMPALNIDTAGITAANIDSLTLSLSISTDAFTGDSIAPLGLTVYPLKKSLRTPMYSSFNPTDYYDASQPLGSIIYNLSANGQTDSLRGSAYRAVNIKLPVELGRKLFEAYNADPSTFASPTAFADKVFKGLYLRNTYGSGRIMRVSQTLMTVDYHRVVHLENPSRDTTLLLKGAYFAVTPEVITNNNIRLLPDEDIQAAVAQGQTIVMAPAGLNAEIHIPIRQIISSYKDNITNLGILNTLTMSIPASTIPNKYSIGTPPYLLLVPKSQKDEFFAKNKITDDESSYYAQYNAKGGGSYTFTGMRAYLTKMINKGEGNVTDDDETFLLVPVNIATESTQSSYYYTGSTYVTAITPYIQEPVMARLHLDKAKITLVYSKQTVKF